MPALSLTILRQYTCGTVTQGPGRFVISDLKGWIHRIWPEAPLTDWPQPPAVTEHQPPVGSFYPSIKDIFFTGSLTGNLLEINRYVFDELHVLPKV